MEKTLAAAAEDTPRRKESEGRVLGERRRKKRVAQKARETCARVSPPLPEYILYMRVCLVLLSFQRRPKRTRGGLDRSRRRSRRAIRRRGRDRHTRTRTAFATRRRRRTARTSATWPRPLRVRRTPRTPRRAPPRSEPACLFSSFSRDADDDGDDGLLSPRLVPRGGGKRREV